MIFLTETRVDKTQQSTRTHIYIYIFHGSVSDPGFYAFCIRHTKVFKKWPINMVNFCSKKGGDFEHMWLSLCVFIVSMFMKFWSRAHIYVYLRIYWHTSLHVYTYFHYPLPGRGGTKEKSVRREDRVAGGLFYFFYFTAYQPPR